MSLKETFRYHIFHFAILWNFADFYLGDLVASFLGLPIVLLGRLIYVASADLFYLLFFAALTLTLVATFVGLRVVPNERYNKIVLPKILGMIFSLAFVKTKIINFFLIGILYNIIHKAFEKKLSSQDWYINFLKQDLELNFFWEQYVNFFAYALSASFLTNLIYHLFKVLSMIF